MTRRDMGETEGDVTAEQTVREAVQEALSLHAVKHAEIFVNQNGELDGVVYDSNADVEYDVRQDLTRGVWVVSDDRSRRFEAVRFAGALRLAIRAQR